MKTLLIATGFALTSISSAVMAHEGQSCNVNFDKDLVINREKYIVEKNGEIIPIEVKSGTAGKLRSLQVLLSENVSIKKALVFSKGKSGVEGKLHFLPIYFAGYQYE